VRLGECCIGSCSGGFSLSLLEFGDPYGLLSSVRARLRSQSSIGNVLGFQCWTQKRCHRVVFRRSILA
jgi:hypothetical protein